MIRMCFLVVAGIMFFRESTYGQSEVSTDRIVDSLALLDTAERLLPVEERYDYHRSFDQGSIHSLRRDLNATPSEDEMVIESKGWKIVHNGDAGPLTRFGCLDTVEYFRNAMQIEIDVEPIASLRDSSNASKSIVVGIVTDFSDATTNNQSVGTTLSRRKDYEIWVEKDRIIVCGWDDSGAMHGLFNLQSRLSLREAPYLPRGQRTVRQSRFRTRMAMSWLGWMQYPDKLLSHMAHDGYDAIYASVYANPNGLEGPPHYDLIRKQDSAKLKDLIHRAGKFGIRVYAPILFANNGDEENQAALREHVRDTLTRFPEIRGYVLLTEGFYFESFRSAFSRSDEELRTWAKNWTEAVAIVSEECRRVDPSIEVVPWEYNVDFRPERAELKRHIIGLLPPDAIPMVTWENGKEFEIDGLKGYLRDYSISQVGPSEVATGQITEAKRRGMKVYCKADCYATWQFGTTPYLPCAQQWQERYRKLAEYGVDGTLETWSNGYKPNMIAELRCWSSWSDSIPEDELLQLTAARIFGRESSDMVVKAWEHFSRAIRLVPDTGPSMGTNNAVAHPLFFQEPPPRIMTLHNSWWDEEKKTPWRHRMEEAWPYCHRMMVFIPDFKNKGDRAESYARSRSGIDLLGSAASKTQPVLPVFQKYLRLAAEEFEAGLRLYRRAALAAPPAKQAAACKEVLVTEQMKRMLLSLHAILEFEDLRLKLHANKEAKAKLEHLAAMAAIVADENSRTVESYRTARLDSRLGYEMEMDYVYSPFVIEQKLQALQKTLDEEIPAFRASVLQQLDSK